MHSRLGHRPVVGVDAAAREDQAVDGAGHQSAAVGERLQCHQFGVDHRRDHQRRRRRGRRDPLGQRRQPGRDLLRRRACTEVQRILRLTGTGSSHILGCDRHGDQCVHLRQRLQRGALPDRAQRRQFGVHRDHTRCRPAHRGVVAGLPRLPDLPLDLDPVDPRRTGSTGQCRAPGQLRSGAAQLPVPQHRVEGRTGGIGGFFDLGQRGHRSEYVHPSDATWATIRCCQVVLTDACPAGVGAQQPRRTGPTPLAPTCHHLIG